MVEKQIEQRTAASLWLIVAIILLAAVIVAGNIPRFSYTSVERPIAIAPEPTEKPVLRPVGYYNDKEDKTSDWAYGINLWELAVKYGCITDGDFSDFLKKSIMWGTFPVMTEVEADGTPVEFDIADPLWTAELAFDWDWSNRDNPDWIPLLGGRTANEAHEDFLAELEENGGKPVPFGDWYKVAHALYFLMETKTTTFEIGDINGDYSTGYTAYRNSYLGNELPMHVQKTTESVGGHTWKVTTIQGFTHTMRPECMLQPIRPPGERIPGIPEIPKDPPDEKLKEKSGNKDDYVHIGDKPAADPVTDLPETTPTPVETEKETTTDGGQTIPDNASKPPGSETGGQAPGTTPGTSPGNSGNTQTGGNGANGDGGTGSNSGTGNTGGGTNTGGSGFFG